MNRIRNLNQNWNFFRQDIGLDAAMASKSDATSSEEACWETVTLPHTWNAVDGANGFDYYKGACWYRRELTLSPDDKSKRVFLEFEGANSVADIYANGTWLGQHRGGFSTFRFDATEAVKPGCNRLAVRVDNTVMADVYPQMADFTFFGGLYRNVNLVVVDPLHVDLLDEGSQGVYLFQDAVSESAAVLTARVRVKNDKTEAATVRVWLDFLDAAGAVQAYAAAETVVDAGACTTVALPLTIDSPILWNGRKNPYLYTARVSLQHFNDTVDEVEIPIGLRAFHVDPEEGFFLNGAHLPLHGVCRHQDRKDMGWAITEREQKEDMNLVKEVGATSIRLAHYQHNRYFYDLCDREGMVIWAEIPFISVMSKTELEGINPKQQLRELIKQNFNHPSICFWGVQNEIQIGGDRPENRRVTRELAMLAKELDPTRLTTLANVMFVPDTDEYNRMTDVVGYNKYYGWYQGKAGDFAPWLDGFHRTNPDIPLCISEYGAEGILRYHSETPKGKDYTEEYHALYHETVWDIFKDRKYLWATYVWNMFDFGANIRDEGGVKGRNNKGLVTYDRKVKKDAFHLYKAHWSEEKFVHICSKRFVERAQETIDVKVYTTCDQATLYLNGQEVETRQTPDPVKVFRSVPLREGRNVIAVVAASDGGKTVCTDKAHFLRVDHPQASYTAPAGKGSMMANWFKLPEGIEEVEIEELVIPEGALSTASSLKELLRDPGARRVVTHYFGNLEDRPMFGMMEAMSINRLAEMDPGLFNKKLLYMINRDLAALR